ncbi:MAG: hypothetical protein BWK76_05620 [Desulfobulbaceae bacterium A2]|nr:MAG: hypothetical protein BWK76_05620 [Desulfobulbaceae bacterium A2]
MAMAYDMMAGDILMASQKVANCRVALHPNSTRSTYALSITCDVRVFHLTMLAEPTLWAAYCSFIIT